MRRVVNAMSKVNEEAKNSVWINKIVEKNTLITDGVDSVFMGKSQAERLGSLSKYFKKIVDFVNEQIAHRNKGANLSEFTNNFTLSLMGDVSDTDRNKLYLEIYLFDEKGKPKYDEDNNSYEFKIHFAKAKKLEGK